jgi:hypothetical protein
MRALAAFIFCMYAGAAYSGYFATGLTGNKAGVSTTCYLMPSMAANALYSPYGYVQLTALSETGGAGYPNGYPSQVYTFSIATCNAAPAATSLPTFIGDVVDPVLASGNYSSGSGGSSSSAELTYLHPELAIEDASAWFALSLLGLASVFGVKQLYNLFARDWK